MGAYGLGTWACALRRRFEALVPHIRILLHNLRGLRGLARLIGPR